MGPLTDSQHDRVIRGISESVIDRQQGIDVADLAVGSGIDLTHPRETVLESSARHEVRFGLLPRETPSVRMGRHDEMERRRLVVVATPNEILQLACSDREICNHQVSLHQSALRHLQGVRVDFAYRFVPGSAPGRVSV